MAFDRTTPAATDLAVPNAPTPVRYSLEFGHTYIPYDDLDGFRLLNDFQQAALAAWADTLIPGDVGTWPAASEVNAHLYADNSCAASPRLRSLLVRAILRLEALALERGGTTFAAADAAARANILRDYERSADAELFELVLEMIFEGYYRDPCVLRIVERQTGFQVMAPVQGVELIAFDRRSLERVIGLPPRVRTP